MDTINCIKTRRSVRKFLPDEISEDVIKKLIDAAQSAPSAGNVQDAEFIIVKDQTTKNRLTDAAIGQSFIRDAPIVIVICSNLERITYAYGERGRNLYSAQGAGACAQNIMLAAHDLGYATCWVGAFNEASVRGILQLPEHVRPLVIIPVGRPKEKPGKRERRSVTDVTNLNYYGNKWG